MVIQVAYNMNPNVSYGIVALFFAGAGYLMFKHGKEFLDFLSSIKFAAALFIFITLGVITGTLILQNVEESRYLAHYSESFYHFIKMLKLEDTYHSIWFMSLVGLLNLNLLLCTLNKLPFTKKKTGFFLMHLSIFLIVGGASISNIWGVRGYIHFFTGKVYDSFNLTSYNKILDKKNKLDFQLRLDKFEVEYYPADYRVYAYVRKGSSDAFGKPYSFKAMDDVEYKIKPVNGKLKIVKFYSNFATKEVLKEDENGYPATKVLMKFGNQVTDGIFMDKLGLDRFFLPNSDGMVIFKWQQPASPLKEVGEKLILKAELPNGEEKGFTLQLNKEYDFSKNYTVKADRVLPSFSVEKAKAEKIDTRRDNPDNPAIRLIFKNKKTNKTQEHWVFQNFPEFSHGQKIPENASLRFIYVPFKQTKPVYIVSGDKKVTEILKGKVVKKYTLKNNSLEFDKYTVVFDKFLKKASVEHISGNKEGSFDNPVVECIWEANGQKENIRFSAKDKNATFVEQGKVALVLRNKETEPKAYRSFISVLRDGKVVKKKILEVNSPLVYGGYYFYQSNFDPKDPNYSGVMVVKDPGVYIVFVGFFMLVVGGVLRFYFKM
jgi:hypothetical protein